ncbi:MAG TPA: transposase [Opitutales bacterium]|nr:transposase [Opitutales bacterium]
MLGCYYDQLPHWVVDCGFYAITLRCKGSLPKPVIQQLTEINESLKAIPTHDPEALKQHRRSFQILEAYLDKGTDHALFKEREIRSSMSDYIANYDAYGLRFAHWVIMPNHLHLMTAPFRADSIEAFRTSIRQFKLRSTQRINRALNRKGPVWQKGWYDRWVRNEVEFMRWQKYITLNPVKAGLCQSSQDWVGLR